MYKILLRTLVSLTAILAFGIYCYSNPVEPVRTMDIPLAFNDCNPAVPAMDGIAEDVYGEVQTTQIFNPTGHDGDADFSTVFRVCWDYDNLYVFAEVTDDVEHDYSWGVGNPWEFDNIELFLQLDTNTVTTSYSGTTVQLRICRGLDSVETAGRASRADYGYFMESAAAGGWIAEVAVPWTAVMAEGSLPEDFGDYAYAAIGFDFAACDSDNSDGDAQVGNRDVQAAWDMDDPDDAADRTEDLAWNNTSVFGYVNLMEGCCAIDNFGPESDLRIIPNPAASAIRIGNIEKYCNISICNMQGKVIMKTGYHPGQEIDISGLNDGLYTLILDGKERVIFVKR